MLVILQHLNAVLSSLIVASIITCLFLVIEMLTNRKIRRFKKNIHDSSSTLNSLWAIQQIILNSLTLQDLAEKSVQAVMEQLSKLGLDYSIVVLALVNDDTGGLERVAVTPTKEAQGILSQSPIKFKDIVIPLHYTENICIKAIRDKKAYITHRLADVLLPAENTKWADQVQEMVGVRTTKVYPLLAGNEALGVMIFTLKRYVDEIGDGENDLLEGFTSSVAIAVKKAKLYEDTKKNAEDLKSANERLLQLDKLKDDFISITSHELRTPLTAIKGYLYLLIQGKGGELGTKQKYYADRSYQSTERLIDLVNEMLDVSRIEGGRVEVTIENFDMVQKIQELQVMLMPKFTEKKISFVFHSNRPYFVSADPKKVEEILINLVGNALKFTPENGKISIQLQEDDANVSVSVIDTGKGINEEDQKRLFTKFGRLDSSFVSSAESGGTGLGLYIVKQYIELLKGTISVSSELGKGSTFTFTLPKGVMVSS